MRNLTKLLPLILATCSPPAPAKTAYLWQCKLAESDKGELALLGHYMHKKGEGDKYYIKKYALEKGCPKTIEVQDERDRKESEPVGPKKK